jgi:hypothetical protein
MPIRKVALAACVALSTIALAGCGLPGLGGGSPDVPVSRPTVATPDVATPNAATPAVPSPSESASTPAAPVAGMKAMKRPTKPFAEPKYPKGPTASAPLTSRMEYEFEKAIWKAAGTADAKATSAVCATTDKVLAKTGSHKFTCTVTYAGLKIPVKVTAKGGSYVFYDYIIDSLPISRAKAEWSAMYSAYNGVAVACDMKTDTALMQVGDEQGLLCHVQGDDGEVDDYYLEMSQYGSVFGSRS